MSTAFQAREASLARKPTYKATFAIDGTEFSTHRVRVRLDFLDESDTVDEFFAIDESKVYDDSLPFPAVDHSPIGDMFGFTTTWSIAAGSAYLHLPATTAPMQILPELGRCSVGAVSLTLTDIDEEVTALVALDLFGTEVTIWKGFHDFDEDDYQVAYRGTVQSVRLTPDMAGYEIHVHNTQTKINKQLFQASQSVIDTALTVSSTAMIVSSGGWATFQSTGYALIDQEIVGFTRGSLYLFTITRGGFNDYGRRDAAAHAANAVVQEIFVLLGHPIDLLLGMYYGTASKTCLGLGYHDIDWAAFAHARDVIGASYQMQFFLLRAENALEFLSRELYLVLGAYPFVTDDGKISIKVFEAAGAATVTFDHDSILASGGRVDLGWGLGSGTLGQPINDVTVNYNYDPTTGKYHSYYNDQNAASIAAYGRFPITINSAGLRQELAGTDTMVAARVTAILTRYQNGLPIITIKTHLQKQSATVGSIAALTSRFIPNRSTGTRGVINAKCEIINRSIQWDDGYVEWTLLGQDAQL